VHENGSKADGQLGLFAEPPQPLVRRSGKTRSTAEAMDVLVKHRRELIERGRAVAVEIARRGGTVHSRQVRAAMADQLNPDDGETWLGAVFNCRLFRWTGEFHSYGDDGRNCHDGHVVKIWRLA
jgi:hypothetical protein